jgi:hypothetical protein
MTEEANVEQKASGALKPVGWLCTSCGTFSDHDKKPDGCPPCESLGEHGDWQPLWGRDAMAALSLAALKACPVAGGGTMQQQADDIVTELTGVLP